MSPHRLFPPQLARVCNRVASLIVLMWISSGAASGQSIPFASIFIEFETGIVRITGLAPGSSVVLLGVQHETEDFQAKLSRVAEIIEDTDSDGEVTFPLAGEKPPPQSVWLAVDLESGLTGFATGDPEFVPPSIDPPSLAASESGGPTDILSFEERDAVDAVFVRFDTGVWLISGYDAGTGESNDLPDGNLALEIEQFSSVSGGGPPPESFSGSDLVLAADPRTLEWVIGAPTLPGEGGSL